MMISYFSKFADGRAAADVQPPDWQEHQMESEQIVPEPAAAESTSESWISTSEVFSSAAAATEVSAQPPMLDALSVIAQAHYDDIIN